MKCTNTLLRKRIAVAVSVAVASGMTILASGQIDLENQAGPEAVIATSSNASPSNATLPNATPLNAKRNSKERIQIKQKNTYTGFKTDEKGTLYMKKGKVVKDDFFMIRGEIYHFDENGYMTIGWFLDKESGEWYYFDEDGTSREGWIEEDEEWYYLENGSYVTGWKLISSDDGEEYWFCFNDDGKMYSDCETPDGYYVNTDGVYIDENVLHGYDDGGFEWNKDPMAEKTELSGLEISGLPAEFYMLCMAGETSGMANLSAVKNGDRGCAYGVCQLDYRYDLVGFMRYAYGNHPDLWPGFKDYLNYRNGNPELKGNGIIGESFIKAMDTDYETAMSDQLEYMRMRYWDRFKLSMDEAGYDLDNRSIAVSAAFFSINVNCGPQPDIFINNLSPDMTDEELIRGIYNLRNTVFARQKVGSSIKGTTIRYRRSEPQMALDLLYGYITIDSKVNYGGGVEWYGNPFTDVVSTVPNEGEIEYMEETEAEAESLPVEETEIELEEIEEKTEEETKQETSYESYEGMVQLIDGTWVSPSEYGPGFEYMPTEEETEQLHDEEDPASEENDIEQPTEQYETEIPVTNEID